MRHALIHSGRERPCPASLEEEQWRRFSTREPRAATIRRAPSETFDPFLGEKWVYVITVCDDANERCPLFSGAAARPHWSFPDPSAVAGTEDERLEAFRRAREDIRTAVRSWIEA